MKLRLRRFQRLQALGLIVVMAYGLSSIYLGYSGKRDAYPLFSWSLFTHVPNFRHDFALLITQIDGAPVNPPADLMSFKGRLSGAGEIRAYYTIQDFGDALVRRDGARMETLRRLLEKEYLAGSSGPLRYRIVARAYDPVEKWRHGRTSQQAPVADLTRVAAP